MRWTDLRLRSCPHLISRLRRQLPLIGEALECVPQGLPSQGRWLGEAETERSPQICSNLSVTFGDSIPTPFVPSGHFPLIGGIGPGGEPFSAAFSSASCRKPARRAAGRKNRPPSPHICPQHAHVLHAAEQKPQNCAHCRRLRPRQRVFCVIFNVLSIKSLNFAGNNARNFIF